MLQAKIQFEDCTPVEFLKSMQGKRNEFMEFYSVGELAKMKLYKVSGINAGFALKQKNGNYCELVCVHNNSNIKGIGAILMHEAIKNGAKYLDHYDGFLSGYYEKFGFKEISRVKFDQSFDANGDFLKKYGSYPDIIFRERL